MSKLQNIIIDLLYSNQSIEQIVENSNVISESHFDDKTQLISFIEKTFKEHQEELEADAYLSSLDCYYDNYCEY